MERPACRAALILNNLGVRLMERHCYNQALLTLRDALALLRLGVESRETSIRCSESTVAKYAQERIKMAMLRSGHPEPHSAAMRLRVLDTESLSTLRPVETSTDEATIIFIHELSLVQVSADQDPSVFESSILMQNFAVIYKCLSRSLSDEMDSKSLLRGARDLQNASSKLLRNHREDCTDFLRLSSLLHLEVIILSGSVALLDELREEQEAKQIYRELQDLVEWVNAGVSFWKSMEPSVMAAGAA
jgi:hypothetical protein